MKVKREKLVRCAVLLAGGRGTRFWPRSRRRTPKQLLNIVGDKTMLRMTLDRLVPVFGARNVWAVTSDQQAAAVRREFPGVPASHILAEPIGRNTAAAVGLAAIHLEREHGDALMAVVPSDSYVADPGSYRTAIRAALRVATVPGHLVILGIPPTRPETGYGYVEAGESLAFPSGLEAYAVKRFTEKPDLETARQYLESGKYLWNAGMFFWRVSTFLENLERFLPATRQALGRLSNSIRTRGYIAAVRRIYPRLQNISVDYAVMEPAAGFARQDQEGPRVVVIPANVGWSDIGSWAAVYELLAPQPGANVSKGRSYTIDAEGNYFWAPKKFVAAIGVSDLVCVETNDALLVCRRDRSQDVGTIVKWLEKQKSNRLL
ncbi:MAG TPA: mannose-1-phosphate guanylyltransferase [Candidatus Cybelea sp.]|nr:mannose-1-phosphate guanylyltransferase [Candidatus Cybelea sp.]